MVVALSLVGAVAYAEPYIAVREGYTCGECHVNHTGGGMRTPFGDVYAQTTLPTVHWDGAPDATRFISPAITQTATIGANLRLANTTVLPATFAGDPPRKVPLQNAFTVPEGNVYLKLDAVRDHASLYLDETISPFLGVREAFLLVQGGPGAYAKVGQFLQPYGVRLLDDDTSTRTVTQVRYDTPQLGVEVGIDRAPVLASLAVTDSGGAGFGKKLIGSTSFVLRHGRIGVSGSVADGLVAEDHTPRLTGGAWGGFGAGRLALFGEVDVIDDASTPWDALVAFGEGDLLVARGVNLKVEFDYHDRYVGVPEDYRSRLVVGCELFPVQFLQVNLFYQARFDIPQAAPADKADRIVLQLHGFY